MASTPGADTPSWRRRFSVMETFDISHLNDADGKRVLQLLAKIELQDKTIRESNNSIAAFESQKQSYTEKTVQKECQLQIKRMQKKGRQCRANKKRYQKEIQEIDHTFIFEEVDDDETNDGEHRLSRSTLLEEDAHVGTSPTMALTTEPLAPVAEDPPHGVKRAGSEGLHLNLKKTVLHGFGKFVRSSTKVHHNRARSDSTLKLDKVDGESYEKSGVSGVSESEDGEPTNVSDALESDTQMNFMSNSDSGILKKKMTESGVDHVILKELLQHYRGITADLESIHVKLDERKTDLETKFNAMQHLLHSQAQMLEYMDQRMNEVHQSLYQGVETGFRGVDERLALLDERIVAEVNILECEVRDSIVDHESVFQHIQDHEGRIKDTEDCVRSKRIDSTRYLSALTPLISALSILIIYMAKASSHMNSYGITPQLQLAILVALLALWLWKL